MTEPDLSPTDGGAPVEGQYSLSIAPDSPSPTGGDALTSSDLSSFTPSVDSSTYFNSSPLSGAPITSDTSSQFASPTFASSTGGAALNPSDYSSFGVPSPTGGAGLGTGDAFSLQPQALSGVTGSMSGLLSDGSSVASDFGSTVLDGAAFGSIGSGVAAANSTLQSNQFSAFSNLLGKMGTITGLVDTSNSNYQQGDQAVAEGFGGGTQTAQAAPTTQSDATAPADPAQPAQTGNLADDATLQAQLQQHEGDRTHVYTDTAGHPTVGVGFNLDRSGARAALSAVGADYDAVRAGTQDLTQDQINQLLQTDTQTAISTARNYFPGFDQLDTTRQRVLTDMAFNMGPATLGQFHGLRTALDNGNYDAAAQHMLSSRWATQVGDRATSLANQMRTGQ